MGMPSTCLTCIDRCDFKRWKQFRIIVRTHTCFLIINLSTNMTDLYVRNLVRFKHCFVCALLRFRVKFRNLKPNSAARMDIFERFRGIGRRFSKCKALGIHYTENKVSARRWLIWTVNFHRLFQVLE